MKEIKTTVYRLACAGFAEKDGTMTNSGSLVQWKNIAFLHQPACLDQDVVARFSSKCASSNKAEGASSRADFD